MLQNTINLLICKCNNHIQVQVLLLGTCGRDIRKVPKFLHTHTHTHAHNNTPSSIASRGINNESTSCMKPKHLYFNILHCIWERRLPFVQYIVCVVACCVKIVATLLCSRITCHIHQKSNGRTVHEAKNCIQRV